MPNLRKQQAEATKMKVYAAASRLLDKQSPESVTIRMICKEAGVSTGALYHYFPTKDSIIVLFYDQMDNLAKRISKQLEGKPQLNAYERFVSFFVGQAEHIANDNLENTKNLLSVQLKNPEIRLFSRNRLLYRYALRFYKEAQAEEFFSSDIPAEDMCDLVQSAFRGQWLDWGFHEIEYDLTQRVKFNTETILNRVLIKKID